MRTTLTCLTVMLMAAALAAPAWAADPAAGDKPAPVAGNQPPPPGPAVPEAVKEQSIYIPYSKLREVFEKEGRKVKCWLHA